MTPPIEHNPFPGPQPYRAEDRDQFFGRDDVMMDLGDAILSHRFLTLFGPSGAGKSSLLQAGVLPMLAEEWDLRCEEGPGGKNRAVQVINFADLQAILRDGTP